MRDHYQKAHEAREALIRADLAGAKVAMKFLSEQQRADALPEALRPGLVEMQRVAASFEAAASLREAGETLAGTFARCGLCHVAAGKGPQIARTPLPEGPDLVAHMKRHHYAAEAMWEGLIMASDERFALGAAALDEPALAAGAFGDSSLPKRDVARLDAHIHGLAGMARAASSVRERAEAYARLLATCATCHKLMERGPKPVGEVPAIPE
jgi:cytochrome c2